MSLSDGKVPRTAKAIMEALRRITSGRPWQFNNKEDAQKGKLRVTFVSVAREAGVSRGLISRENTVYQEERAAVLKAMGKSDGLAEGQTSSSDLVTNLRQDKRELERQVRVQATRIHDAFLENLELQKKYKKLEAELADAREALRKATVRQLGRA